MVATSARAWASGVAAGEGGWAVPKRFRAPTSRPAGASAGPGPPRTRCGGLRRSAASDGGRARSATATGAPVGKQSRQGPSSFWSWKSSSISRCCWRRPRPAARRPGRRALPRRRRPRSPAQRSVSWRRKSIRSKSATRLSATRRRDRRVAGSRSSRSLHSSCRSLSSYCSGLSLVRVSGPRECRSDTSSSVRSVWKAWARIRASAVAQVGAERDHGHPLGLVDLAAEVEGADQVGIELPSVRASELSSSISVVSSAIARHRAVRGRTEPLRGVAEHHQDPESSGAQVQRKGEHRARPPSRSPPRRTPPTSPGAGTSRSATRTGRPPRNASREGPSPKVCSSSTIAALTGIRGGRDHFGAAGGSQGYHCPRHAQPDHGGHADLVKSVSDPAAVDGRLGVDEGT